MTPWELRTIEFANCNCDYGCPCQFNALPTHSYGQFAHIHLNNHGVVKHRAV